LKAASRRSKRGVVAALGLVALGWGDDLAIDREASARDVEALAPESRGPKHRRVHGADFPDGVLALTWDDGPDEHTLDLARYLKEEKVAGTFFVVSEWIDGVSEEPGVGPNVFATGYRHVPILGELVALGHRVGGHTQNHVLLADAATNVVGEQLATTARELEPYIVDELRMFRAPGGAWSRDAAAGLADPFLASVIGPMHWNIDAKDWEGSLYCRGAAAECEPGPIAGRMRVRPEVIARRYLAQIETTSHGIVLLHDRVGDVGSRYALDVARHLIPALRGRGFVFAPPVLEFSAPRERLTLRDGRSEPLFVDNDGDGRADFCSVHDDAVWCARATTVKATGMQQTAFDTARPLVTLPSRAREVDFADIDGDGRRDVCVMTNDDVMCALGRTEHGFGPFSRWTSELGRVAVPSLRLADVDGDGRADACVRSVSGVVCATSDGRGFGNARLWLALPNHGSRLELADLDGDRRADLCLRSARARGVDCALSNGRAFAALSSWSSDLEGELRLGDLNGDGRADVCAPVPDGIACALSGGRAFKRASTWSNSRGANMRLADINGDGRVDLCFVERESLVCGLAP
jgi:peptidoglycan/xylan/chitin deacetylase (PgdA/CDA1 family)